MRKAFIGVPLLVAGLAVGGIAGVLVSSVFAASSNTAWQNEYVGTMGGSSGTWGGMMGGLNANNGSNAGSNGVNGWAGMMGLYMSRFFANVPKISSSTAAKDVQNALTQPSVTIDKTNNAITYSGNAVHILAVAGMAKAGDNFQVDGLTNPTLNLAKGAKVTLQLINEDTDMPHGIEITSVTPPYAFMSMMQGGIYQGSFIHPIPEAGQSSYPTDTVTFTANQGGTYYYICPYPGHAQKGMYGKIVIS